MNQPSTLVRAEDLVEMIRIIEPEIIADAAPGTSFKEMEFDSLSMVEISIIVGDKYGIAIQDWEVVQAGSFAGLAELVNDRRAVQAAR